MFNRQIMKGDQYKIQQNSVTSFQKKFSFYLLDKDWKTLLWGFKNDAKHPCSSIWADIVYISV